MATIRFFTRLPRRLLCFGLPLLLLLLAPAAALWALTRPTHLPAVQEINIQPGMSARRIGAVLEERGLIRSARVFQWTTRLQGRAHQLEAGTYHLSGTSNIFGIIQDLLEAPVRFRRITIPEGLTRHEVAGLLQRHAEIDSARFVALSEDPSLIRQLELDAPTLEGYLFPETYFFDLETTEKDVIRLMVEEFHNVFADSLQLRLGLLDLTLHQVVILASIVEREARIEKERSLISAVFQRRLAYNRRLESCATVEYALGVHKKRLTNADLQVDSPFNTYRHHGLPPGPIGNPGLASILAILYPEETDYLYFVARGDGGHIFSRTNEEHEQAKRSLSLARRRASLRQTP